MNAHRTTPCGGYTLVEMMAAIMIMSLVIAGSLAGYLYVVRGERVNSIQGELDINVRQAMNRLWANLRLSSMDKIFFYPEGNGPYEAISLPMARDDDGDGALETNEFGKIIWDQTLIYHVWPVTPNQLRVTTFDPRDNNLTDVQRQQQLNSVVTVGNGSTTFESAGASTIAVFENLFDWAVHSKSATYDGYNDTLTREANVILGSVLLTPGAHDFKFTVKDKTAGSSGYAIGIDSLVCSPCGVAREGEAQLPVSAQVGAAAAVQYMPGGQWSGNNQLLFPAAAIGNYVTLSLPNDRWEESNFGGTGSLRENVEVRFDETLTPKDFVLRVPTGGYWQATVQTRNITNFTGDEALRGYAVRVLVKGTSLPDGGALEGDGPLHCLWFRAGAKKITITDVYIAESLDATNYCWDTTGAAVQLIAPGFINGGYAQATMPAGSSFYIDRKKSYLVSFLVADVPSASGSAFWDDAQNLTNSWLIPGGTVANLTDPTWSDVPSVEIRTSLYTLERLHILAPPQGTFASQIVDTQLTAPQYTEVAWNAIKPAGTDVGLKIRTGDNGDMSDALAWSNITAITSPGAIAPGNRRYVQFQAILNATNSGATAVVPSLKDVTIKWTGEQRVTDVGGTFTKGPGYGIFDLTVDGKPLVKGLTVDLTIFEDVFRFGGGSNRLTSSLTAEVEPRNTGK